MKKTYKYAILSALVLLLSTQGCKKDFLDINENPNNPEDVDVKFILPAAQADLAYTVGNQLHIVGGLWAQYWTQGTNANQYNDYDRYFYNNTEADRPWGALYRGTLKDLDVLYKKAKAANQRDYMAITRILQAYTLQVITDAWGDVPFSEALQGFEGNTTPKFDSQEEIYDMLIALVDEGIGISDTLLFLDPDYDPSKGPQADDLVFQGDYNGLYNWNKFAYTLKLKIYLRQINVRPSVAANGIAAMPADPFYYLGEGSAGTGDDAFVHYVDEQFRQNPLYTTVVALSPSKNIFASKTAIDYLESINDPRIADFYDPNGDGDFVGIIQGGARDATLYPPPTDDADYSEYNTEQIIAPTVPVRLMTASESMFLQAEAIARGLMAGDAQALYEAAIEDSWLQWVNASSDTSFATYIAQAGVVYASGGSIDDQVKAIITQKWIAMNGNQNFEAWTEFRRTGYPDFFVEPVITDIPGQFPARLAYPSEELTANPNAVSANSGMSITSKLWWDVN